MSLQGFAWHVEYVWTRDYTPSYVGDYKKNFRLGTSRTNNKKKSRKKYHTWTDWSQFKKYQP